MATKVQRGGFGLDKLFRRQSRSPDEARGDEKNGKITEGNDASAKVPPATSKSGKDRSSSDTDKIDPVSEVEDAASEKTDVTKKSKKKKKDGKQGGVQEVAKTNDKTDDEEACKEYIIKDEVGEAKLTEIINNSIKNAVLNIVKEGVCPLVDLPEPRAKEQPKKLTPCHVEETQDKTNKPESPKILSTLMSSANKTFDSHLCRSQCQSTNQYQATVQPITALPRTNERAIAAQCNRELCPRAPKDRKTKCSKPREKKTREVCPKVTRQVKGSSHFRTDNRRMTGNVNIYICSEANENTKDPKKKTKDCDNPCDETESASETKTCASSLSISTSKLVAALRKKKCAKTLNDESLSCLCETSDSSQQRRSVDKIGGSDDDVLCLCDENAEPEFPDSQSSSSRDGGCLCEDGKFSETDFPDSAGDSDLESFDRFTSYDKPWMRATDDCPSYSNGSKRFKNEPKISDKDNDPCCSCCNLKRCVKNRKGQMEKSCIRESRERNSRTHREVNGRRSSTSSGCPCIVEEEDEECCGDRKETEVKITVCTNKPINEIDEESPHVSDDIGKSPPASESAVLQKTESPDSVKKSVRTSPDAAETETKMTDDKTDASLKKPQSRWKKSKGSSGDPSESVEATKKPFEIPEALRDGDIPANEKRKDSFFRRSMRRAMSIVKAQKDEDPNTPNKKTPETSLESQIVPQPKTEDAAVGVQIDTIPCMPPCCGINEEKPTIVPCRSDTANSEKHSRSRISTAIASRRSLATGNNKNSCVSLSPCQGDALMNTKVECICEKLAESCDCRCKKPEPAKEDNYQCRKVPTNLSVCSKKPKTTRNEIPAGCFACRNPTNKCICLAQKPIQPKPCKCCPGCKRPLSECVCGKSNEPMDECCECCQRPKRSCCCERNEDSPSDRPRQGNCRRSPKYAENRPQYDPSCGVSDARGCEQKCCDCSDDRGPKSMICMYCDQPRDKCICRAPIRKCSQCCMPLDVCNCKPTPCCDCNGRQIAQTEQNGANDQTMCVTAWKPRRKVRRYFERTLGNGNDVSDEDCACWEKPKPYGSDSLPYQKRGVFSDVMSELQQKISESVCCNVCGKDPCCCCCVEAESDEKIKMPPCLSTMAERRSPVRSRKRSLSKSPVDSCKCEPNPRRKSGRQSAKVSRICDRCRTSPCRCKRSAASPQKKPQAKCYYCKNSPCSCTPAIKTANSCPFRNNDSSRRRRKERCGAIEKNIDDEFENNDNGYRGHEGKRFVPCSGNQQQQQQQKQEQQQIRKYCYRGNANGHCFTSGERVR